MCYVMVCGVEALFNGIEIELEVEIEIEIGKRIQVQEGRLAQSNLHVLARVCL